jgi:hypothetical protein
VKGRVEACFVIVSLVILVAFLFLPLLVRAADYHVGVKVGDWIKYGQFKVTWSGNGTEPSYVTDEKKVDWVRFDVENVSGTAVTLNATAHYNNGTQTSQSASADVASGQGMTGIRVLIASNLKAGDPIVDQANSPTINQTTSGAYAGATRNVNLLDTTSVYGSQTTTVRIYWDQGTGAMVEMYLKTPDSSSPGAYIETSIKATETNMWSADLTWVYIVAGIAIAIVVIAAAVILRRKKTTPPPPPPPEPAVTDTEQE